MHPRKWTVVALLVPLALAGCTLDETRESSQGDADNARHFTVDVPDGATQLHVDVSGTATAGEPDVTVLVEDTSGNNLASDTFSLRDESQHRVTVDASGHARMVVTVRVVDGDADLDVKVSATVPNAEPVVIVEERVVIVQVNAPPTTTTTTPTTPPASPTPTQPTPTEPTPTSPPVTNTTNQTNGTNATG